MAVQLGLSIETFSSFKNTPGSAINMYYMKLIPPKAVFLINLCYLCHYSRSFIDFQSHH